MAAYRFSLRDETWQFFSTWVIFYYMLYVISFRSDRNQNGGGLILYMYEGIPSKT